MASKRDVPHLEKTTAWLLESQTPSIRYFTLTRIKGLLENNPEVSATRLSIPSSPPVSKILEAQQALGHWADAGHIYSPKYRSAHWTMLLLSKLGLAPGNASLQKGADFMLAAVQTGKTNYLRLQMTGFGCFWGDWLRYELYCGKGEDDFTGQVIDFVCRDLERRGQCRYNADLPCAWAVARGLFGLALIPEGSRDEKIRSALDAGLRFLLEEFDLPAAIHPADQHRHPLWDTLSFPLYYHADRLFILRVLKELNALNHPKAQQTLDWLLERQTASGIWRGGSPLADRSRPFLAKPDGVERWLTLHALEALT